MGRGVCVPPRSFLPESFFKSRLSEARHVLDEAAQPTRCQRESSSACHGLRRRTRRALRDESPPRYRMPGAERSPASCAARDRPCAARFARDRLDPQSKRIDHRTIDLGADELERRVAAPDGNEQCDRDRARRDRRVLPRDQFPRVLVQILDARERQVRRDSPAWSRPEVVTDEMREECGEHQHQLSSLPPDPARAEHRHDHAEEQVVEEHVMVAFVVVAAEQNTERIQVGRDARDQTPEARGSLRSSERRARRTPDMSDVPADERVRDGEEGGSSSAGDSSILQGGSALLEC